MRGQSVHSVQLSAIEFIIVTNHKPIGAATEQPLLHSSAAQLSIVSLYCALRSVTAAPGAEDFKHSTCLSISLPPLGLQAHPAAEKREGELHDEGQSRAPSPLVSGLSLTLPMGQACRTLLVLLVRAASCPLQLAVPPCGPSCTLHSYIDFFGGALSLIHI